jgi:hypothetical protein
MMMKRASMLLVAAALLGSAAILAGADTGTYRILDYRVTLAPHSDGKVTIDYYQKWQVTGGHIPWITIGVPNENIQGLRCGLNAKSVNNASSSDWSGIRLDLDRDYQPGQTFEVSASLLQNRLFYADEKNYRLDFTPGWYDRARTDHLEVRLKSFVKPETITADPPPTSRAAEQLIWTKAGLGEGERFSISIAFPKNVSAQAIPEGNLRAAGEEETPTVPGDTFGTLFVVGVIALIVIIWLVQAAMHGGTYTGGGIFWGGGGGLGGGLGGGAGGRASGGGGGFGGAGISCACACVSCACACACAGGGGGGAGCDRKARHTCYTCDRKARG